MTRRPTTSSLRSSSVTRRPVVSQVVRRDSSSHGSHSKSTVVRFGGSHHRPAVKVYKHVYVSSHHDSHWPWWHRLWAQPHYYNHHYPSVVVVRQPSLIIRDYGYSDPYYNSGGSYYDSDYYEPAAEVYYDSSLSTPSSSVPFYGPSPAITTDTGYLDPALAYPVEPVTIRFWSPWSFRSIWQRHLSPYDYYRINYQWGRFRSFWWNDYFPTTFVGQSYLHFRL